MSCGVHGCIHDAVGDIAVTVEPQPIRNEARVQGRLPLCARHLAAFDQRDVT